MRLCAGSMRPNGPGLVFTSDWYLIAPKCVKSDPQQMSGECSMNCFGIHPNSPRFHRRLSIWALFLVFNEYNTMMLAKHTAKYSLVSYIAFSECIKLDFHFQMLSSSLFSQFPTTTNRWRLFTKHLIHQPSLLFKWILVLATHTFNNFVKDFTAHQSSNGVFFPVVSHLFTNWLHGTAWSLTISVVHTIFI